MRVSGSSRISILFGSLVESLLRRFPVGSSKLPDPRGQERSRVVEATAEKLAAWHLQNFTSLSGYCFTVAEARVSKLCAWGKDS